MVLATRSEFIAKSDNISRYDTVTSRIPSLKNHFQNIWWNCSSDIPSFINSYTRTEQFIYENKLDKYVDQLFRQIDFQKKAPEYQETIEAVRQVAAEFLQESFHIPPHLFAFIDSCGIYDSIKTFFILSRKFDPDISIEDIYQAGRNVITANLIQMLLGLPVRVSPSIFAYSMLYPYTDNYLDDPSISSATKYAFNMKFLKRLQGEMVESSNPNEKTISTLVGMIESEWDRMQYPKVYESLLSIYQAQVNSLSLVSKEISPFEKDILGISFEKGGTSVLTDGYLIAGDLTLDQEEALFGFGAFTQLMDDLEDVHTDLIENRASIFSTTSHFCKLDRLFNRFYDFGHIVIQNLNAFPGKDVQLLSELMTTCIDPMLLTSIGQAISYFDKNNLGTYEIHMPFHFSFLEKQRQKVIKNKKNIERFLELGLIS